MRMCRISVLTVPVSKIIRQNADAKKRNPEAAQTATNVDGKCERLKKNQCSGITHGGRNTKIHVVVDAAGNLIHVQLSSEDILDETLLMMFWIMLI